MQKGSVRTEISITETACKKIYQQKMEGHNSPISLDDYRIVRDQLYGDGRRSTLTRQHIPYAIFLSPILSRVGDLDPIAWSLEKEMGPASHTSSGGFAREVCFFARGTFPRFTSPLNWDENGVF